MPQPQPLSSSSLDEATKRALNALSSEDVNNYRYMHAIALYGLEALAHNYLVGKALEIESDEDLAQFLADNDLVFGEKHYGSFTFDDIGDKLHLQGLEFNLGFITPLRILEKDGIFVPEYAYKLRGDFVRTVHYFSGDYTNMQPYGTWKMSPDDARGLMERRWQPEDFKDKELMSRGLQFGQDLWSSCVAEFERYKGELPTHVATLAQKLINYYSAIIYLHQQQNPAANQTPRQKLK